MTEPRQPRLRDETGTEIDLETGERATRAAGPVDPQHGDVWINTDTGIWKRYDANAKRWEEGDATGEPPAARFYAIRAKPMFESLGAIVTDLRVECDDIDQLVTAPLDVEDV